MNAFSAAGDGEALALKAVFKYSISTPLNFYIYARNVGDQRGPAATSREIVVACHCPARDGRARRSVRLNYFVPKSLISQTRAINDQTKLDG